MLAPTARCASLSMNRKREPLEFTRSFAACFVMIQVDQQCSGKKFNPTFPAASPYVTAVGALQVSIETHNYLSSCKLSILVSAIIQAAKKELTTLPIIRSAPAIKPPRAQAPLAAPLLCWALARAVS